MRENFDREQMCVNEVLRAKEAEQLSLLKEFEAYKLNAEDIIRKIMEDNAKVGSREVVRASIRVGRAE